MTSDAYFLGKVEGIEVDTENWTITHLRVILTKDAVKDMRLEPLVLLDIVISLPVKLIKAFGEPIYLNVPLSELPALLKSQQS